MTTTQREQVSQHLRALEALGVDVKDQWRQLSAKMEEYERGTPTELDLKYKCPLVAPKLAAHFVSGVKKTEVSIDKTAFTQTFGEQQPCVLSASCMWPGYHYTLTPGQRAWLRSVAGLTIAKTATIDWLELWPGTQHPRSMKVSCDLHVSATQKGTQVTAVVREVGKFLTEAAEFDAESRKPDLFELNPGTVKFGFYYNLESVQRWAVKDLCGVEVMKRVQVTLLSDTAIRFECQFKGNQAMVSREEFFKLVDEYQEVYKGSHTRGYSGPRKKRAERVAVPQKTLDELMADLERGEL